MIITCPACEKKFQIDATLIPNEGRTLQCGSCGHQWFYKKKIDDKLNYLEEKLISKKNLSSNKIKRKSVKNQINIKKEKLDLEKSFSNKRDTAIVKYEEKQNFTFTKFLGYILIIILSFLAMIIIIDTFKSPLSIIFPNVDNFLYSLYEIMKDIFYFIKDLIK